ncbi:hypothetical protein GCM10027275_44220 [Rhabdobacter roseus]|uniref:DNA-binding CsgD family transcriptional regulator n=1 Tax=Rhabdobacter roseus TaxID=1655419 RepID=A0A840TRI2_9BACT|nr:response regulator transcription factor [Rhabdobacter roseus]MBB5286521.1 DNA-binding CsgD family transcriptional regulator [Rhabdobacter roseus]
MNAVTRIFHKNKPLLLYGVLLAFLVFILKWLQWKFLIVDHSVDLYAGLIALFFTVLGVWVANQLAKPKVQTVIVEKEVYVSSAGTFVVNEAELKKLNLTSREYEILQLLAQGHRNADVADRLFLSLSTIKTHVSNVFVKLDVSSRTQAIEKAKRLRIIP